MPAAGEQLTDTIRDGLVCPGCEYSLRGLPGDVVSCPECGRRCDVVELVRNQWIKPWWRAPYLNRVGWPTVIAAVGLLTTLALLPVLQHRLDRNPPWEPGKVLLGAMGVMTPFVLMWLWLMLRAKRSFAGWEGVWLALWMHLVFVVIFVGSFGLIGGLITLVVAIALHQDVFAATTSGVVVLGASLCLIGGRLGERWVAKRCIRRYLQVRSITDPANPV